MRIATLCILLKDGNVCLGLKKRALGSGKYNFFGGGVEDGETKEQAALRELREEAGGVRATKYEKVAIMTYHFPAEPHNDHEVHTYLVTEWEGEPKETDEMTVEWFSRDKIPYDRMWHNDRYWVPAVLEGKKVRGKVVHDGKTTIKKNIEIINGNL